MVESDGNENGVGGVKGKVKYKEVSLVDNGGKGKRGENKKKKSKKKRS